jgi:cobalt-zinc-cadmium efflux system protein
MSNSEKQHLQASNCAAHSDSATGHGYGHGHEHNHGHNHGHNHFDVRKQSRSKLGSVLGITAGFMVVEALAGYYTGSLALMADAGHMLGDVAALGLALFAVWLSSRPAGPSRTYGYHRSEILAALANSVLMVVISLAVFFEALHRFASPPEIHSIPMLVVAVLGIAVNLFSMRLLSDGGNSLNNRAAYLEVFSDMLAAVAVLIAGIIMLTTGFYLADPILSAVLAIFILVRTWNLLKESVDILMESAPPNFDLQALTNKLIDLEGVGQVHDLHVWTITSGLISMSCHITMSEGADSEIVLDQVREIAEHDFAINHTTIQIESANSSRKCNDTCTVP